MKKINVLALVLALMLLLAGCAEKDPVVISVNGETLTLSALTEQVDAQIAYNQQINNLTMSYYGVSAGYPTDRTEVATSLANACVNTMVALQKAKELGMDQLTEEETAAVKEAAQAEFDRIIASVASSDYADLPAEEATQKAIAFAKEKGVDVNSYIESETKTVMLDKLQAEMIKDVTVSDDEVQAAYDKRVEEDKAFFDLNPKVFGDYINQDYARPYYAPEGYRYVKHILVQFTENDLTAINQKRDMLVLAAGKVGQAKNDANADVDAAQQEMDAAQAALDEAIAAARENIQARVDEVLALATAEGADFDALVAQYNQDPGMPEAGYVICEGYPSFVESFVTDGMALANIGDVSQPSYSDYGCHIIKYVGDLAGGAYEAEAGLAEMKASMLSEAQNKVFEEKLNQWISEADVKIELDKLLK